MRFISGVIPLGEGRLSSAVKRESDSAFIIGGGGALYIKTVKDGIKTALNGGIISYADDCFLTPDGKKIEMRGAPYYA